MVMLSMIRYDVVVKVFSDQGMQESMMSMPLNVFYKKYVQESVDLAWKITSRNVQTKTSRAALQFQKLSNACLSLSHIL